MTEICCYLPNRDLWVGLPGSPTYPYQWQMKTTDRLRLMCIVADPWDTPWVVRFRPAKSKGNYEPKYTRLDLICAQPAKNADVDHWIQIEHQLNGIAVQKNYVLPSLNGGNIRLIMVTIKPIGE